MKELFLSLFVILFIACQTQPSNLPTSDTPTQTQSQLELPANHEALLVSAAPSSSACDLDCQPQFDLASELQNSENPGIHYRAEVRNSQLDSVASHELICASLLSQEPALEPGQEMDSQQPVLANSESKPIQIDPFTT